MSIHIIKLVSGEELIAKVLDEGETDMVISDVIIMVPVQLDEEGTTSIVFLPWMVHADIEDGVCIKKTHILCSPLPKKEVADKYKQAISNIIQPDTNLQF